MVIIIPDLHHKVDLLHHEVVPHTSTKVVLPINSLHIRVGLTQHTGSVDLVVTETVMDTEICQHMLEILVRILVILVGILVITSTNACRWRLWSTTN